MDYKKYQFRILCEDKAHYNFVRGWLEKKGAHRRVENIGELPHEASGKVFVMQNFAAALKKVRNLSARVKTFLIVVIDADNNPPDDIVRMLPADDLDPVFYVIPKWSIETWARFLMEPDRDDAIDESKSCKNEFRNAKFTNLGKQLADMDWSQAQTRPDSLLSSYNNIRQKKRSLALI